MYPSVSKKSMIARFMLSLETSTLLSFSSHCSLLYCGWRGGGEKKKKQTQVYMYEYGCCPTCRLASSMAAALVGETLTFMMLAVQAAKVANRLSISQSLSLRYLFAPPSLHGRAPLAMLEHFLFFPLSQTQHYTASRTPRSTTTTTTLMPATQSQPRISTQP